VIGQTLGHYRIESQLGSGGMGVVYRAHDTTLGRTVAIKLVGERFAAEPSARARLLREARTASALNHPHICTVHEVGEANGQVYIVMEHVEGRPLSALLSGQVSAETAVRYGIQIADALAHAHQRGIVHRDLKSANVMVTPEGRAKVLDFGLAKRLDTDEASSLTTRSAELSEPGQVAGTLHYLAPEVLRGHPADARTDVWALGVLLYELAAGQTPFRRKTRFEVTAAILGEPPAALPPGVPAGLRAVILRCLAKDPDQRYPRAGEVRAALEAVQSGTFVPEAVRPASGVSRRRALAAGAAGAAALAIAAGVGSLRFFARDARQIDSIAVLPFANVGGNPETEYLSDGVAENVIGSLSRLPDLRVIAFASVLRYKGRPVDPQEVVRDLGVGAAVIGRITHQGTGLVISAELIDARDKSRLWGEQYEVKTTELQSVQQEISRNISGRLRHLSGEEKGRVTKRYTENAEAYDLFLKGRYYWLKDTSEDYKTSLEFFQRAVQKDPDYAPAHAWIALVYAALTVEGYMPPSEGLAATKAAVAKAQRLDDSLAEVHWVLSNLPGHDGEKEWQRALALDPQNAQVHRFYAGSLRARRRWDDAIAEGKRAQALDPLGLETNKALAYTYYYAARYDEAIAQARKTLEIDPNHIPAHELLAEVYARKGMYAEAIAQHQRTFELNGLKEDAEGLGQDFKAYGYETVMRQLYLSTVEELKERAKSGYVSPVLFAAAYAKLGDVDQALPWLEKGLAEGSPVLGAIGVDPDYDKLRSDPRFTAFLARIPPW
jgi:TolB-like protein/Tfp pilus assembly protein PilF